MKYAVKGTMWSGFWKNRMMSYGVILLTAGICVALLGFGAAMNHSDICLVTPGGYSNPCSSYYRVALFAPLYPLSAGLMLLGALLTIVGYSLTAAGYSKKTGTKARVPITNA